MRRKTKAEISEALWGNILQPVLDELESNGEMKTMVEMLMRKESDPYTLAENIADQYIEKKKVTQLFAQK